MGSSMTRREADKYLNDFMGEFDFIAGELERLTEAYQFSTEAEGFITQAVELVDRAHTSLADAREEL